MPWTCSLVCETDSSRRNLFVKCIRLWLLKLQVSDLVDGRQEQRLAERVILHPLAKWVRVVVVEDPTNSRKDTRCLVITTELYGLLAGLFGYRNV